MDTQIQKMYYWVRQIPWTNKNYDRFELDAVIAWWKKLATKCYNKMIAEGKVRKELEVWNKNTMQD